MIELTKLSAEREYLLNTLKTTITTSKRCYIPELFGEGVPLDVESTQSGHKFRGHLDGHFWRLLCDYREDRVPLRLGRSYDAGGRPLGVGGQQVLQFADSREEADGGVGGGAALDRHPCDLAHDREAVLAEYEQVGQSGMVHGDLSHEQNAGVVQGAKVLRVEGLIGLKFGSNVFFSGWK